MTNELAREPWLFRFRWFMPLTLLPLALLAALEADPTGMHLGRSLKDWWEGLCLLIALTGLVVRALAVGFPEAVAGGRADELELPTTGMYSIVRYPLFLGTYISLLGLSLLPGAIWFVLATNVVSSSGTDA
jgi:protein-S-isoprenylcysteine O-methyltransferase Ste14